MGLNAKKVKRSGSSPVGTQRLLTEVELELMTILWKLTEGSVADVMNHLSKGRDLAYTSVSTILRILEQKKVLKARREGRGHVYIPVLTKAEYERRTVEHVVERVFDGAPVALARHLLGSARLDPSELDELRALIDQVEKQGK